MPSNWSPHQASPTDTLSTFTISLAAGGWLPRAVSERTATCLEAAGPQMWPHGECIPMFQAVSHTSGQWSAATQVSSLVRKVGKYWASEPSSQGQEARHLMAASLEACLQWERSERVMGAEPQPRSSRVWPHRQLLLNLHLPFHSQGTLCPKELQTRASTIWVKPGQTSAYAKWC